MNVLTVIYDGDCGICKALCQWAERRDTARRLHFLSYQTADFEALAPGLTRALASRSVYAVQADGERWQGARAVFEALRRLPGVWRVIGTIGAMPVIAGLAEPFYRVVAHHRTRLSRWLRLDACRISLGK